MHLLRPRYPQKLLLFAEVTMGVSLCDRQWLADLVFAFHPYHMLLIEFRGAQLRPVSSELGPRTRDSGMTTHKRLQLTAAWLPSHIIIFDLVRPLCLLPAYRCNMDTIPRSLTPAYWSSNKQHEPVMTVESWISTSAPPEFYMAYFVYYTKAMPSDKISTMFNPTIRT